MDPALGLSALHTLNIFSLSMALPLRAVPPWVLTSIVIACGVVLYWLTSRIYRSNRAPTAYAKITDNVPNLREFPAVYMYLLFTLIIFVVCLYAAVQAAPNNSFKPTPLRGAA
jgi:uncharacterized membrane protein